MAPLYYEVGGCFRCWDLQRQLDELEQELQQSRTQVARLTVEVTQLKTQLLTRDPPDPRRRR
jgi:cell division protein FtsB